MHEPILEFLKKKQGYVSGEELVQHAGISRQALWKQIHELRQAGYEIVSVPHLGYQLLSSPDRLFPREIQCGLRTRIMGRKVCYFDHLGSTMDAAMELGIRHAPEGTLVVTEAQSKGRGRLARQWSSPRYKGIYGSLIIRPDTAPGQAPLLTLMSAVSICEAIQRSCGIETAIKWPNDIMLDQRKLGGILTEMDAETDRVIFVVIGFGINVNNDRTALVEGAISLAEHAGRQFSRVSLMQQILREMERWYLLFQKQGSHPILVRWRQLAVTLGRQVTVHFPGGRLEGEAVDIDSDGGLLVRTEAGIIQKIFSGDVVHCR